MWGLNGAFGIDAQVAWSVARGSPSLVVVVLDSGIQTHPDLASSSQVAGYDFITEVPSANDGDGRDADPSDPGDWVSVGESGNSDGPFYKCEIHDSSWHGTHVTGTINAASDNGIGVSSVAPQVKVQPVRVLGKCGGALSDIFDAIAWSSGGTVPNVSANPTPAAVINLSLGGSGACSDMLQSVLDAAVVRGSTIVVSAGNEGSDAGYSAPASCANVVTVGASNSLGKRAAFSNHGSKVDLSAPGSGIWSTSNSGSTAPSSPTYQRWDGTSMAAPHVAGLAALVKATNPGMTPTQIEARLRTTTSEFAGGGCSDWVLCGTGIANAAAVTGRTAHADPLSAHPPGRVRTIKTVYKGRKAVVKWTKPTDTGRASILGYHFQIKKSGTGWSSWKATTSKKKTIRRTKQAKYVIKVAPINSAGRGQVAQTRIKRK